MARRMLFIVSIVAAILFHGCGDAPTGPGNVAQPLVGFYALESRSLIAQDSAATTLRTLHYPELRASLVLTPHGRYAYADTIGAASTIRIDAGQWSVINNQFFTQSDTRGFLAEEYTFDKTRLVRTIPDIRDSLVSSGLFKVTDVWLWLKRQ